MINFFLLSFSLLVFHKSTKIKKKKSPLGREFEATVPRIKDIFFTDFLSGYCQSKKSDIFRPLPLNIPGYAEERLNQARIDFNGVTSVLPILWQMMSIY